MTLHDIGTENMLHALMDDFCTHKQAVYIGFDLHIHTDLNQSLQRTVHIGIHLLKWNGRIIGAYDNGSLFPEFKINNNWEEISTHTSCWADSTMVWMVNMVKDVMENENKSKFTQKYLEERLSYDIDNYSCGLRLEKMQLIDSTQLFPVRYVKRTDNSGYKHKLYSDI